MLASLGVFVEWMFEIFGGHRKEASHRFEDKYHPRSLMREIIANTTSFPCPKLSFIWTCV